MNILLVDTETTGLKPERSFILSNGSILYNTDTKDYSEFYEVINWDTILSNFFIPEDTIKVHGITKEIMHDEGINPIQSMSNYYEWIKDFCERNKDNDRETSRWKLDVIVAFNLAFDLNMFVSNLKFLSEKLCNDLSTNTIEKDNVNALLDLITKEPIYDIVDPNDPNLNKPIFIDSLIIDRIFNFEVDGEKVYHDLQTVGERYGIPEDPNAHNAIADTRRTFEVFKIQIDEVKENLEDFDVNFENRLFRRYNRNQTYWKKDKYLDYFGRNMDSVKGGVLISGIR